MRNKQPETTVTGESPFRQSAGVFRAILKVSALAMGAAAAPYLGPESS